MEFNGRDLSDLIIIKKIRRSISAPVLVSRLALPMRDGSIDARKSYGDRVISVDITIMGETREDMIEKAQCLADVLDTENRVIIKFDDEEYFYMGALDGNTNLDELLMLGDGTLTFVCDAYRYGDAKKSTGSIILNGLPTKKWKITITCTGSGSGLTISDGTDTLEIVQALVATDVVIVDFELGLATLNGVNINKKIVISDDFFKLKGNVTVTGVTNTKLIEWQEIHR